MLAHSLNKKLKEAGCDEAGRGCLSGPVVAAAVILPPRFTHPLLDDSKKMTEKARNELRKVIEKKALEFSVQFIYPEEIDQINILNASFLAMKKAVDDLQTVEFALIDGNRFTQKLAVPHKCIIKGDGKYRNIAAASVLAKTYRDEYMLKLHGQFPEYGWDRNKGYPTAQHRSAIAQFGLTEYHRKSFNCLPSQLPLFK